MFQGCASPEDFERWLMKTVQSQGGRREHSPGALWGLELVQRRIYGRVKDDTVEDAVVDDEGEIHDRRVYDG